MAQVTSFLFLIHKVGMLVSSGNDGAAASGAEMLPGKPQHDAYTGEQAMEKVQEHRLPVHQDRQASCAKTQDEHKACASSWAQVRPR